MATKEPAAQRGRVTAHKNKSGLSLLEAIVAAGAAALFAIIFAPLLTYGVSIVGLDWGLSVVVIISATIGIIASLYQQWRN